MRQDREGKKMQIKEYRPRFGWFDDFRRKANEVHVQPWEAVMFTVICIALPALYIFASFLEG